MPQFASFAIVMDFDFGTLLYIVLAVIYFIVQSGSKNKKKRSNQRGEQEAYEPGESNKRRPTFEELLAEFTGQQPQKDPEPIVEPVKPVVVENASQSRRSVYEIAQEKSAQRKREAELEVQRIQSKTSDHLKGYELEEEEEQTESSYATMFENLDDVKKAFVASEIFRRKYH